MIPQEQLDRLRQDNALPARIDEEAAARAAVAQARRALQEAEAAAEFVRRQAALAGWLRAWERAELIAALVEEETHDAHAHVTNAVLADELQRECREMAMAVAIILAGIVLCVLAALTAPIFWVPGVALGGVLAWLLWRCYTLRHEQRDIQRDLAASERRLIESGARNRLVQRAAPLAGPLGSELDVAESALREAGEPIPQRADEARARLVELPAGGADERTVREALGQIERRRGHLEAALARLAAARRQY